MIGEQIAGYRLVRKLGEGGMGVVYVGEHERLGSKAAIKLILPEFSTNAEIVARFFNEAKAATQIDHPAIVRVFDFGHHPSGSAYFVMEMLSGESLASRLHSRRVLSPTEVSTLGRQIAGALQAAHAAGIVHRDLKPDNLFLVKDADVSGGERVKILDFGIAKLATDAGPGLTRTGSVMGTPYYMSPEQCRSSSGIDHRSDIYSLGAIMFEMACGRPPFLGEGTGEILGAHQHVAPPSPQTLSPGLPEGLASLISACLAKRPEDRPQSMAAVVQALDVPGAQLGVQPATIRLAEGVASGSMPSQPTTLSGSASQSMSGSSSAPRKRGALLLGVAGVLVVGGVVVAFVLSRSSSGTKANGTAVAADDQVVEDAATKDLPTLPSATPDAAPAACTGGQSITADTASHCCWSGQSWANDQCVGIPTSCPPSYLVDAKGQACVMAPCDEGQEHVDPTHCCWAGQAWNTGRSECVGIPTSCPPGKVPSDEDCVADPAIAKKKADQVRARKRTAASCVSACKSCIAEWETDHAQPNTASADPAFAFHADQPEWGDRFAACIKRTGIRDPTRHTTCAAHCAASGT